MKRWDGMCRWVRGWLGITPLRDSEERHYRGLSEGQHALRVHLGTVGATLREDKARLIQMLERVEMRLERLERVVTPHAGRLTSVRPPVPDWDAVQQHNLNHLDKE